MPPPTNPATPPPPTRASPPDNRRRPQAYARDTAPDLRVSQPESRSRSPNEGQCLRGTTPDSGPCFRVSLPGSSACPRVSAPGSRACPRVNAPSDCLVHRMGTPGSRLVVLLAKVGSRGGQSVGRGFGRGLPGPLLASGAVSGGWCRPVAVRPLVRVVASRVGCGRGSRTVGRRTPGRWHCLPPRRGPAPWSCWAVQRR